jgi:hypothetical protein
MLEENLGLPSSDLHPTFAAFLAALLSLKVCGTQLMEDVSCLLLLSRRMDMMVQPFQVGWCWLNRPVRELGIHHLHLKTRKLATSR